MIPEFVPHRSWIRDGDGQGQPDPPFHLPTPSVFILSLAALTVTGEPEAEDLSYGNFVQSKRNMD